MNSQRVCDLSSVSARPGNWQSGLAAACDRLVDPTVTDPRLRKVHRRLIGILLAAPFLLAGVISQVFYGTIENGMLLAINCVIFAAAWIGTAMVAATAKTRLVQALLLASATAIIGIAIAGTGLLQSPLVLLLLAPPFECWWLHRSRGPSNKGWWASIGACALALLAVSAGSEPVRGFSEHLWVFPLLYAVTMWMRFTAPQARATDAPADGTDQYERTADLTGTVIMRAASDGQIAYATHQADALFGVPRPLLLGKGLFERLHVTDRVAFLSLLADMGGDGERRSAELRVRMPASGEPGQRPSYQTLRFEFVNRPGEAETLLLVRDDAEMKALRASLAEARDKADGTEIATGRFLASVSHELRTPLNAIIGFADMLKNEMFGPFPDPRQHEYVKLIGQSGNHLLSVVNAILDVSKIESGNYLIEPEPFAFGEALEMCHSMMIPQARAKDIAITREVDNSVGDLCADQRAVQQILINLVSNAVKFTPEGGRVHITADVRDDRLRFRVNDNGIGISAEDLERIGQPFIQVQNDYTRQFEGTGLGLSLVKGLVGLHKGEMLIDSAPDCGTTVSISLPLEGPEPAGDGKTASVAEITDFNAEDDLNDAQRKQA